jgi:hypothetical protein
VTLALDAVVVAGGIFFGRLLARVLRKRREGASREPGPSDPDASSSTPPGPPPDPLAHFPCKLGDVVVRKLEGDEAWLAGALLFEEDRPVAVLFIAPDAVGDRAVLVPTPAQPALTWLAPLAPGQVAVSGEPPRAIEHAGTHFERTRRRPLHVRRLGSGAPDVGDKAVLGEYAAAGLDRLVVVAGSGAALAWRGVSLMEGDYDLLPGGKATLD